jgi:DNA-binding transcriptional LysR family regulator
VAQPTLSAGLRQLEEELGVPVVERGNRFKGFTPLGERVLAWAQRILADCDSLEQELVDARKGLRGRIVVGVVPSALAMTPFLTNAFLARQPGVSVRLLSRTSAEIQRGLDAFDLHAGITYLDNEPLSHVRSQPLYRERHVLLAARGHDLEGRASITWAEAAKLPLCLMVSEMQHRRIVDAAFARAGAAPVTVVETDSMTALVSLVREGGLVAVASDHLLRRPGVDDALLALRLEAPEVEQTVGLVIADREPLAPLVAALWATAQATAMGSCHAIA